MEDFPALPQVKQSSVKRFFESIEPLTESKMMPVWNGELYLEYHRGTYTSQARNKRANRKSEFLLHDSEFISTYASLIADYKYPASQFSDAWRTVCLNQFHDIIPGVITSYSIHYTKLYENPLPAPGLRPAREKTRSLS